MWVGTAPKSSVRVESALNYGTISLAPLSYFLRWGLSLSLRLTVLERLAGQWAPWDPSVPACYPPALGIWQVLMLARLAHYTSPVSWVSNTLWSASSIAGHLRQTYHNVIQIPYTVLVLVTFINMLIFDFFLVYLKNKNKYVFIVFQWLTFISGNSTFRNSPHIFTTRFHQHFTRQ